mmetsp:Transcript_114/g.289  ORF Transcript_114/g.289 Transcript_114/m.289 type:complete len:99 (+) Transcript_114:101-397(+)
MPSKLCTILRPRSPTQQPKRTNGETTKENASKWHPGQDWITSKEGFGVLDILCNPLSMLDEILGPIASDGMKVATSNVIVPRNWSSPISGVTVFTVEE